MSSKYFRVIEHVIPGQHIRGYARATAYDQEEVLQLAVKQYVPLDNPNPRPGDITIIGGHANGFPKELYEPLWDEILLRTRDSNISIRGIWIADAAHQGASGILNEGKLGNDPSWFDHPRDLLLLINTFRSEFPRPIVGIGHSMGGNNLVNLSLMHPRLLTTLVLIDPVIQRFGSAAGNYAPAAASAVRRDRWPSRAEAAMAFKRSKFYQAWDSRVLDLWIKHGLRDLPTALYPTGKATPATQILPAESSTMPAPPEVTLMTTKHQEVFTFLRPNPSLPLMPDMVAMTNHSTHPDIDVMANPQSPFYRPEAIQTFNSLPHVRPTVLYIFGELSALSAPAFREDKMKVTGIGVGGNGGAVVGRVEEVLLEGVGHLIPMEKVGETADHTVRWVSKEIESWRAEEKREREEWARVPGTERAKLSQKFVELVTDNPLLPRRKPKGEGAERTKL